MSETLVDSSIVIDAQRDLPDAVLLMEELLAGPPPVTHAMVVAEVIEGAFDARDLAKIKKFFRPFRVVSPNEEDAMKALEFLPALNLSHDIGYGDCLIAATAIRMKYSVTTTNDRHFRLFKGLTVIRPY